VEGEDGEQDDKRKLKRELYIDSTVVTVLYHRQWMREQAFLVVRPRLSSPNPNFSKPRSTTENSYFSSRLTHQLLGRLKSTIPSLQMYLPKNANSAKLGLGIHKPCRIVFFFLVCG
jgi:hypothetical protein